MIKIGDKVKWEDPAIGDFPIEYREDILNTIYEIISINGEVITIANDYSEIEVFEHELTKI